MRFSITRLKEHKIEYLALTLLFLLVFINNLRSALVTMPRYDALEYIWSAEALLKGKIAISPQQNYFFSLVLASAFFIFGDKLIVAQIVATLISTLAVITTHFFTKEVFADKSYNRELGLIAALLVSITLQPYSYRIGNDHLFLLFFLLACYYALKGVDDNKYLKFTGVFSGLAYLTRDPGILLIPVFVVYVFLNRNDQRADTMNATWRLKFVQYKNLLIMVGLFLLIIAPKLFWKWFLFGSPFYIRNSNFWLDNYEDKYNTKGFLPNSFDYQPSLIHYLQHHTLQQIIERWLLGMYRMIITLQNMLIPTVGLFLLMLLVMGLLMFRKRRDLLLHLNIAIWFFVFSWLFGMRLQRRWIISMHPFTIILVVGAGVEIAIILLAVLIEKIHEFHPSAFIEKSINYISNGLPSIFGKLRWRRYLRTLPSSRFFVTFITLLIVFSATTLFVFRSHQIYTASIERRSQSSEKYRNLMELVDWAKINTAEDAKFMAREGNDVLRYYAHRECVNIPNGNLSLICWVIRNEGVDYLVIDSGTISARPALKAIFEGNYLPEGFSLVYKNYESSIHEEAPEIKIQVYTTNSDRSIRAE